LIRYSAANSAVYVGLSDALTVKSSNVGIGTTNPGAKLDVNSGASSFLANFNSNVSPGYIRLYENGVLRTYLGYGDAGEIATNQLTDSTVLRAATGGLHLVANSNANNGI